MTEDVERIEGRRDQALRDIVDLERQVDAGEIPPAVAQRLRDEYEAVAAAAIRQLESPATRRARPRGRRGPVVAYVVAAVVALFAVVVLLPGQLGDRPAGGAVSGNEVLQQPSRDLSAVTDEEMEQVIAANPGVAGMRLALVRRYVGAGAYDKAAAHLEILLQRQPDDRDRASAMSVVDDVLRREAIPAAVRDRFTALKEAR
ncbi:hypothetical protein SAMN04488074_13813 [Lentzea albidocapillata subsp. violacea]|uniref:Tetratricopeptide repeat protein n=1 Tax=Lentzea albidocapillata subsp. violacea TaxID=128104 RepID=A0A1G9ZAI5_9PSEU|nr:tetratricopeptide repeat protein [Lentzea albidocapillata]SDN17821.1 hypothetical protein SAMN04488074_13813 [Lentzea albidocapillata subsp. violacea]